MTLLCLCAGCGTPRHSAGPAGSGDVSWPLDGARVTAPFGMLEEGVPLQGVRLASRRSPGVLAWSAGTVVMADERFGEYGGTVILRHGEDYVTVYAGLAAIAVRAGQEVGARQVVGQAASGPDGWGCYFEIRRQARAVDPAASVGRPPQAASAARHVSQ